MQDVCLSFEICGETESARQADRCSIGLGTTSLSVCRGKEGAKHKGKLLDLPVSIYVPTLSCDNELWVVVERTTSRVQAAKMSLIHRLSLRDTVV